MIILSSTCVNSFWIADFLAKDGQECCECFGQCKVRVQNQRGIRYILTENEIKELEILEEKEVKP